MKSLAKYLQISFVMMMMLNSCTKEKMPAPVSTDADKDLQQARGVRPDFTNSKLICQLGNFYGDWLNYQNANASIPFHEMRFDTVEVVMPSSWNLGKECYEVDPITQQEMYQELSTAVGTAESRVDLNGLTNPHVVAVAVEILKPKITNPTDFDGYEAPFNKGEIDTIYVGDQQPYKFRVITAVGGMNLTGGGSIIGSCFFTSGVYDIFSSATALSIKANQNPCWPSRSNCRYFRDVKYKLFEGFCGNNALYHVFGGNCVIDCATYSPTLGYVYPNFTFNAQWMNYFLGQGRTLAQTQGYIGYDIVGYQWTGEHCLCNICDPSYGEFHKLLVTYGKCSIDIPTR